MRATKEEQSQEAIRLEKVKQLRQLNIEPYPAASFSINSTAQKITDTYTKDPTTCQEVIIAGRLMSRRIMGKVAFGDLKDHTGNIQLYFNRDILCPSEDKMIYNILFKKLLDLGDIIGIHGNAFITKVGALAVNVKKLTLLTKATKPLPAVKEVKKEGKTQTFYSFSNPEHRYRQRYVDLILNQPVKETFLQRTKILNTMREYFNKSDYLEVETPILQPIYGGAAARPFKTHHNTLDMPLYLRISNELYLKRLIVGGFLGVYEFSKDFRNEGMSRFHNPEFTLLELYVAYKDYYWAMDYVETLIKETALALHGTTKITVGNHLIDFGTKWKRFTIFGAIKHFTNIDVSQMDEQQLRQVAVDLGVAIQPNIGKGKIIDEIFSKKCEPNLIQPTIIMDHPIEMSPLAKQHRKNPNLVERFEVICNGKEICNTYSELNDPLEQRKRFENEMALGKRGDAEAMILDEDYLRALSYAMPPTVGIGIGIDRLVMIMTNAPSIQEVILFPQMRQEEKNKII